MDEAAKVQSFIREATSKADYPSYCADLWKSKARVFFFLLKRIYYTLICQDYYVAITLQYIDNDWKLRNVPIAFTSINGPHTAKAVGEIVADKLSSVLGMNISLYCLVFIIFNYRFLIVCYFFLDMNRSFVIIIVLTYFEFTIQGEGKKPFAGVIDGGDIASVGFTAEKLECEIKDNTCICHLLNNLIKRILQDYFEVIIIIFIIIIPLLLI